MYTDELQIIQSKLEIENNTNIIIKWHSINSKQKIDALNIGDNSLLLSMLNILTPVGTLSFIINRVSLIRNSSINFGKRRRESFWLQWFIQLTDFSYDDGVVQPLPLAYRTCTKRPMVYQKCTYSLAEPVLSRGQSILLKDTTLCLSWGLNQQSLNLRNDLSKAFNKLSHHCKNIWGPRNIRQGGSRSNW